ncbi:MAG: TonB-dependent receptor [Candidatus Baltobacteraceae bacterium]
MTKFQAAGARVAVAIALSGAISAPALAANSLSGVVYTETHALAAGAAVTLTGNNVTLRQIADSSGRFTFGALGVGSYEILAETKTGAARARIDLGTSDASVKLTLLHTVALVKTSTLPPVHGSGTDLTMNQQFLARSPASRDFPSLLLQIPGAARGANGVVHINGDHGDINYIVDGVPIPQELNRSVGSEFDPADVSFVEVLQGAYPARYGERFASVVNISTRVGNGAPGFSGYTSAGSYAAVDSSLGYHGPLAGGSLVVNLRADRNDRFLDPPNFDSAHNQGINTNGFFRFTKTHGNDYWNLTLSRAFQTFQLPNDVAGGEPASTDDNEMQTDFFGALQFHHALLGGGSLSYGVGYKRSQIRDFPDPENDFTYGINRNLMAGGQLADCRNGIVSACAYSLFSNRAARDVSFNVDNDIVSSKHDVRYGVTYGETDVQKLYSVTLQPVNFLGPVLDPANPRAAYSVVDNEPNTGHNQWLYLQDSWKWGDRYQLDYGLRSDSFQVFSSEFSRGFSQTSPRAKLSRFFGSRASVYAYYGRFFTPFSLENVSPVSAQRLNLPNQPGLAQFDLRPQRDSVYETGAHLPVGSGQLGFRVMQKNAMDLIDDTQVGVTALHQDINYAQGSIASQTAYYQQDLALGGRFYASLTHTRSVNKGCETQLLAPCFGAPDDWTPADHDQRWDAAAGAIWDDARGGWITLDAEYGSGLSSAGCDPSAIDCKVPPHMTFDLEKGIALRQGAGLTLTVRNLLNDRYRVTYLNAQGNHYAAPRTFELGLQFR